MEKLGAPLPLYGQAGSYRFVVGLVQTRLCLRISPQLPSSRQPGLLSFRTTWTNSRIFVDLPPHFVVSEILEAVLRDRKERFPSYFPAQK